MTPSHPTITRPTAALSAHEIFIGPRRPPSAPRDIRSTPNIRTLSIIQKTNDIVHGFSIEC